MSSNLNDSLGSKEVKWRCCEDKYEEHGGDADAEQAVECRAAYHLLCTVILD